MSDDATLDEFADTIAEENEEGSRITGLGTFPSDWDVERITRCAEIRDSERIPLNSQEREQKKPGEIPYYGANGVLDYISEYIFDSELILLAEDGGHFEEYQKRPVAYRISGKSWVNNHAHILETKDDITTDYLFYSLEHRNLVPYVSGSTRSKLTQTMLKKVEVPVPPLSEQRKIATVLHTVDQAIQKTEEIIDQTRQLKKGLHQSLFRNWSGITTSDPLAGEYPAEWELMELSEVVDVTDAEHFTPDYTNSGTPVLRPGDLTPGRISLDNVEKRVDEETYKELTRRHTPSNKDIVYSRSQNFAVASQVIEDRRYCLGQDTVVIQSNKLNPTFLLHLLNSPVVESQAIRRSTGSTFSRVNLGDIRSFKIPIPSEDIQQQIATRMSEIEERLRIENQYLNQLQRFKRGLMQDLLSGEVRTTDVNIDVPQEVAKYA